MSVRNAFFWSLACATLVVATSCSPGAPQTGSQTNWLSHCETSADCGDLECLCGTCTARCSEDAACASTPGASSCVAKSEAGAAAACDGEAPSFGLCLPRCEDGACASGSKCVAEVCVPALAPTAHVSLDPTVKHQTLIGFGASLGYTEEAIASHPAKAELFDAMFVESGFDVLRIRNRFEGDNAADLSITSEIVAEAEGRLGRKPQLFLTSGSPPAALKQNGDRYCGNADTTCTLVRDTNGGFDYAGFAEYWRASLEAYEAAGLHPDFVSIQNNVDWLPPDETSFEACRFLPEEATVPVQQPDGSTVDAEFPGYADALAAVQSATSSLGTFAFAAPEVGSVVMLSGYADSLPSDSFGAFALHFYGTDPTNIDTEALEGLKGLAAESDKPIIQSEMQADGFDTAVLAHHALTSLGAAAYLQQGFVSDEMDDTAWTLIGTDGTSIVLLPAYHALAHFARHTDPGWVRVDSTSDTSPLLVSAWVSPDETSVTVVLVNSGSTPIDAEVSPSESFDGLLAGAQVTRTSFDGDERSAELGALTADRVVRIPSHAIVTLSNQ